MVTERDFLSDRSTEHRTQNTEDTLFHSMSHISTKAKVYELRPITHTLFPCHWRSSWCTFLPVMETISVCFDCSQEALRSPKFEIVPCSLGWAGRFPGSLVTKCERHLVADCGSCGINPGSTIKADSTTTIWHTAYTWSGLSHHLARSLTSWANILDWGVWRKIHTRSPATLFVQYATDARSPIMPWAWVTLSQCPRIPSPGVVAPSSRPLFSSTSHSGSGKRRWFIVVFYKLLGSGIAALELCGNGRSEP